jgi:hypothetical protein
VDIPPPPKKFIFPRLQIKITLKLSIRVGSTCIWGVSSDGSQNVKLCETVLVCMNKHAVDVCPDKLIPHTCGTLLSSSELSLLQTHSLSCNSSKTPHSCICVQSLDSLNTGTVCVSDCRNECFCQYCDKMAQSKNCGRGKDIDC